MNWHKGDAASAIKISKDTRSLFIVYVKGNDPISVAYDNFWLSDKIIDFITRENCVAMTIESDSEVFKQFSQIYPVMIIPTVYFIGNDGKPLEVIVGRLDLDQFFNKINHALNFHKNQLNESSEQTGTSSSERPIPSINEEDSANQLSIEEKAEKARRLIAEKRAEKERQEREEQKLREIERREMGQGLSKLKELKAEIEMKEAKEELKKRKEDDKKALENIRRQLELDRQERAKNFYQAKNLEEKKVGESLTKKKVDDEAQRATELAEKMKTARIQFRLPDGSSIVNNFSSDLLFQSAFDHIRQNTLLRNFTMSMTFPKREFTEADKLKSFIDLGLSPSALLIVLPVNIFSSPPTPNSANGGSVLSLIFAPLLTLWTWICAFLSGIFWPQAPPIQPPTNSSREPGLGPLNSGPGASEVGPSQEKAGGSKLDDQRRNKTDNIGLRQRKEGNIHRLSNYDDDDENNTYNGNSTQQL